jgi:cystathionine gamma-synthase
VRFETLAVHPYDREDQSGVRAVVDPISLSTIYERHRSGDYPEGYSYTRASNPNRTDLEHALAHLEAGAAAAAFSSGSAATSAVFQALSPGDHVICSDAFYGTKKLLELYKEWGLTYTLVDSSTIANVQSALRRETKLIWIETPSNPMMRVTDIRRVGEIARQAGATLVVDNTAASPVLQRPLDLGADMVMHSTTKYLGGHSDLTGGALVAPAENDWTARLRTLQTLGGAVPSAFDCWLLMRGIRSLPWRMRGHCENAAAVAAFLAAHEAVEVVHYPGLGADPGHAVAARQMHGAGGMVSVQVKGGAPAALEVVRRVRLFTRATSLGGTESLIEHRASVEGPESRTPPGLLRLSIGLEHADDLLEDLDQALRGGYCTASASG